MTKKSPTAIFSVIGFLVCPTNAHAHLVNTGVGPFYNGLSHPFVNPLDLMVIVALAIWAGMQSKLACRWVVISLTSAWVGGLIIGSFPIAPLIDSPVISAAAILLISLAAAIKFRSPIGLLIPISICVGFWFGRNNGLEFIQIEQGFLALVGIIAAVFTLAVCTSALSIEQKQGWQQITLRVLCSWMAAASLLIIGWEFRAGV